MASATSNKQFIRNRKGFSELSLQLGLIGGAVLLYFGVRGLTQGNESDAVAHGLALLDFERSLGLNFESFLQQQILDNRFVVTAVNWVYIWGHWPVIVATLLWLHRSDRDGYLLLRNAMFVSGAIGLVIFISYPVAPPRLLGTGMVDTVTDLSNSYRVLQPPSLVNKYAALPSLHVGWNLLVGIALFRATSRKSVKALALLSPAAMIIAVVLTANHYVVDAMAGAAVASVGWWVAYSILPGLTQRTNSAGDLVTQLAARVTPQAIPVRVESQQAAGLGCQHDEEPKVSA